MGHVAPRPADMVALGQSFCRIWQRLSKESPCQSVLVSIVCSAVFRRIAQTWYSLRCVWTVYGLEVVYRGRALAIARFRTCSVYSLWQV